MATEVLNSLKEDTENVTQQEEVAESSSNSNKANVSVENIQIQKAAMPKSPSTPGVEQGQGDASSALALDSSVQSC